MATKTPSEIVADKIATQKALRAAGFFRMVEQDKSDARAEQIAADASSGRLADAATAVAQARHSAAMVDYKSGNALDRAVEAYKVKRAVSDLGLSEGRNANGAMLPTVAEIPAGIAVKAAESDSQTIDAQ